MPRPDHAEVLGQCVAQTSVPSHHSRPRVSTLRPTPKPPAARSTTSSSPSTSRRPPRWRPVTAIPTTHPTRPASSSTSFAGGGLQDGPVSKRRVPTYPSPAARRSCASRPTRRRPAGWRSMKCDASASEPQCAARRRAVNRLRLVADVELVALLLAGDHTDEEETQRLARELLGAWGGLGALAGASFTMLRHLGLDEAQAAALLAAREVACRLARRRIPRQRPLDRLEDVARFLVLRFQQRDQEVMGALFLDIRRRLLGEQE